MTARLMAYVPMFDEDRVISFGPVDELVDTADLLPTNWPGMIVHIEGAKLQHWGAPADE